MYSKALGMSFPNSAWHPVPSSERYLNLDVVRGVALFGVLLVNLLSDFRISLIEHIQGADDSSTSVDRVVDFLVATFVEFKALSLFSLLFGVGLTVFDERARARMVDAQSFHVRRLLILLGFGMIHLLFIWNGDILTLYALCGLLLLPFLSWSPALLTTLGTLGILSTFVLPFEYFWPSDEVRSNLFVQARLSYASGSFVDVFIYHWRETKVFILPLLISVLPRTWGLMALGAAAWKAGIFREPDRHLVFLRCTLIIGVVASTAVTIGSTVTLLPEEFMSVGLPVPLALAYAAGLTLLMCYSRMKMVAVPLAAAGQMALTNYLTQSVILSVLFYGYGLGLYATLGSASASLIGVSIYIVQLAFSMAWLRRYRFGPFEWLWRSLSYGYWQPLIKN